MAIAAWGSTRGRRVPVYIAGGLLMTIAHAVFGLLQTPLLLCIGMFAIVFPLPIANVPFFSMLQSKVPPDLQGRVFALVNQLSGGLRPIGMLLIGPLADQVIEPAVGTPAWEPFAPFFGNSAGAGIGLIFTITGLVMVALNLLLIAIPSVRTMEQDLPDYEA
jgi:hypothetical protein